MYILLPVSVVNKIKDSDVGEITLTGTCHDRLNRQKEIKEKKKVQVITHDPVNKCSASLQGGRVKVTVKNKFGFFFLNRMCVHSCNGLNMANVT